MQMWTWIVVVFVISSVIQVLIFCLRAHAYRVADRIVPGLALSEARRPAAPGAAVTTRRSKRKRCSVDKEELDIIAPVKEFSECGGESDTCPVCLEDFESGVSIRELPCHHSLHSLCIERWCNRSRECPVCREVIALNEAPADVEAEGADGAYGRTNPDVAVDVGDVPGHERATTPAPYNEPNDIESQSPGQTPQTPISMFNGGASRRAAFNPLAPPAVTLMMSPPPHSAESRQPPADRRTASAA